MGFLQCIHRLLLGPDPEKEREFGGEPDPERKKKTEASK
jgi:hypothetical protein